MESEPREPLEREDPDTWFFEKYGFAHSCTCAEDVAVGNVRTVPGCTMRMLPKALTALEETLYERDFLRDAITALEARIDELEARTD